MSEIKEKTIEILCESNGHGGGAMDIVAFIQANYIPKEEHEKALLDTEEIANTRILEKGTTDVSFAVIHREQEMEQEFDNRLLDFKIELQNQILRESIRLKLDNQQTDILNDNLIGVFDFKYFHVSKLKEDLISTKNINDSFKRSVIVYQKEYSELKEENERLKEEVELLKKI